MNASLLAVVLATLVAPLDAERSAQSSVSVAFLAYSSEPDVAGPAEAGGARIEAVWISLQEGRVWPAASCKRSAAKTVVSGPLVVELVKRGASTSNAARLDIGQYCAFEVQLRRSRGDAPGASTELKGASIVIQGRRPDGVRFVLRSRLDTAPLLRARSLEGLIVTEASTRWILGIDLGRWFAGVELSTAEVAGHGRSREVRIDERANSELLAAFNANVESGVSLFDDLDGDGDLDEEERAHPIAVRR